MRRRAAVPVLLLLLTGCATLPMEGPARTGGDPGEPSPAAEPAGVPAAAGRLRQQDITVALQLREVRIRVTPLDPEITRLTVPDTRRRLESLPRPAEGVSMLVQVFTADPAGARFEPESVTIENRGRVFRPTYIRGLTPGWGTPLEQDVMQQAVYTFSGDVDLDQPMTLEVGGMRIQSWSGIIPTIDAERARLRARGSSSQVAVQARHRQP